MTEETGDSLSVRKRPATPMVNMEKTLAGSMAREAATLEDPENKSGEKEDDFEFFDLDE